MERGRGEGDLPRPSPPLPLPLLLPTAQGYVCTNAHACQPHRLLSPASYRTSSWHLSSFCLFPLSLGGNSVSRSCGGEVNIFFLNREEPVAVSRPGRSGWQPCACENVEWISRKMNFILYVRNNRNKLHNYWSKWKETEKNTVKEEKYLKADKEKPWDIKRCGK